MHDRTSKLDARVRAKRFGWNGTEETAPTSDDGVDADRFHPRSFGLEV